VSYSRISQGAHEGAGFAVVADEVRNLAMRAAQAAKNTSDLIEGTVKRIREGSEIVDKTSAEFSEAAASSAKMSELIGEITAASSEQSQGIEQINRAVGTVDKVVQQTAANAEESASASEGMNAQAEQMKIFVRDLSTIVGGSSHIASARKTRENRTPEGSRSRESDPPSPDSRKSIVTRRAVKPDKGNGSVQRTSSKAEKLIPFAEEENLGDF
jgi:methyl-accepting chemotaxis protein